MCNISLLYLLVRFSPVRSGNSRESDPGFQHQILRICVIFLDLSRFFTAVCSRPKMVRLVHSILVIYIYEYMLQL